MSLIPTFSDMKSTAVVDGLKQNDANAAAFRYRNYNLRQWAKPQDEEEVSADDSLHLRGDIDTEEVVDGADAHDTAHKEEQTTGESADSVEEQVNIEAVEQEDQNSSNRNNDRSDEMYNETIAKMMQKKIDQTKAEIKKLKQKLSSNSDLINMLLSGLARSSSAQDEVIQLIIGQYTADSTDEKEMEDRLENAFEAMKLKREDGKPVQINGYPYLYVGSVGASLNEKLIRARNITHVVNWSMTARCDVWGGINYLCIDGVHGHDDMSRQVEKLRDAVDFVERARLAGGSIMSHCWYGRNRSVTLLVAYLMTYAGMDVHEATSLIAETRPQAYPYYEALASYKERYLDKDV